jgi:alkaline phosphatase
VLTVPKKNMPTYKKMALEGGGVWKKFGALDFKECVIDDEKPSGVVRTFRKLTGAKPSEAILFSFITYRSRKERDKIQVKVMTYYDEKFKKMKKPFKTPFAMDRMSFAGFKTIVDMGS